MRKRAIVGRADLLKCLARGAEHEREELARSLGYLAAPKEEEGSIAGVAPGLKLDAVVVAAEPAGDQPPPPPRQLYYRVVEQETVTPEQSATSEPAAYIEAEPLFTDDPAIPNAKPPPTPPLTSWSRLWPFLHTVLGGEQATARLDIRRLVNRLARRQRISRLPRLRRERWAPACRVLIDYAPHLRPFWDDFNSLYRELQKMRGRGGLDIFIFQDGPLGPYRRLDGGRRRRQRREMPLPQPDEPILVLGDLGCLNDDEAARNAWLYCARRWQGASGLTPVALMPCPPRLLHPDLAPFFKMVCWDRNQLLPSRPSPGDRVASPESRARGVDLLLTLLAPVISIEPALLRAARYLLPRAAVDAGTEAAVWSHPELFQTMEACGFGSRDVIDRYRREFRDLEPERRAAPGRLLLEYHGHLPGSILAAELAVHAELCGAASEFAEKYLWRAVKTMREQGARAGDITDWVDRISRRFPPAMWQGEVFASLRQAANLHRARTGEAVFPEGFDQRRALWVWSEPRAPRIFEVRQQGLELVARLADKARQGRWRAGSPLGRLTVGAPLVRVRYHDRDADGPESFWAREDREARLPLSPRGRVTLESDYGSLTVDGMVKPTWATAVGRDVFGLFVEFKVGGVAQRLRWIPSGRFMMGSPGDEVERYHNETQHEVILTKGYWLADTACTQELWEAVMGNNPSRFKDGGRFPVETVSWDHCREFLGKINGMVPELELRLPTEAEWEYACRAGTTTPFSFGKNITPDQVNYNGKYPYADGEKGEYREKTVEVKSLPVNPWGLYEMHGNVWEWCSDWFDDYPKGSVRDPRGPSSGEARVLRGGSWVYDGWRVRSAYRYGNRPSDRNDFIGFRLARGQ